jgi:hypothetical protein
VIKATARGLLGQFREDHYKSIYFHEWSERDGIAYDAYLDGLAEAAGTFASERGAFLVLAGSEMLDRGACEDLAERFSQPPPVLVSDEIDMYDFVSMLRCASYMVSSRYHAMVTSMPGGVPSIGVTMDERIHNLLHDRGHAEYLFRVDDEDLGEALLAALRRLEGDADRVRAETLAFVPSQIRVMGQMGMDLVDEVQRVYPAFPVRDVPRTWERHLPPLSPELERLLEEHGDDLAGRGDPGSSAPRGEGSRDPARGRSEGPTTKEHA